MTTTEWAENEVRIKKERECKAAEKDGEGMFVGYVAACLDSALKAYKSLSEDGHSGMSFSITRSILEDLMHDRPLSPIEDVPESWSSMTSGNPKKLQCVRRSSLFKDIKADGTATYRDIDNDVLEEMKLCDGHISCLGSGRTPIILKHYCPEALEIKFPYLPPRQPWRVRVSEEYDGPRDLDVCYLAYIKKPNGEFIDINKFIGVDFGKKTCRELTEAEIHHYCIAISQKQFEMINRK